ncbi:serine threonine [Chlorella sorokiniana]|uniref:Serine threonine n=1 Tax=Chlorella sorokiniana TaxID=3076 RepID=A0A2P6TBL8_CHLSO|nr:serine threonine [Chlorella sorokiniana]|eukprot:PRW05949.1 serine threonine [Chlorella sorokiniana]
MRRAAVAGLADAVTSAGMSLAAALMQKQHLGKPPGIAELAVEVLENLRRGGVGEADLAALLSNPQTLREQRRARRVMPQLELIFGQEGAAEVTSKRPALLGSSPSTVLRALAAMAVCGVQAPLALARHSPILLQYCHDSESLVTTRLALQHYLGLSAAEVYRTYPTYLLPAARTLACRLQFLADLGRLHLLVRSRSAALRQWRQQAAAAVEAAAAAGGPAAVEMASKRGRRRREQQAVPNHAAAAEAPHSGQQQLEQQQGAGAALLGSYAAGGAPPFLTLSHVVKQSVESFCSFAQLDESAFREFEAGFSSHPAWLALQQRGRAEAAHLTRVLDELQVAAAAAQGEQAAGGRPQRPAEPRPSPDPRVPRSSMKVACLILAALAVGASAAATVAPAHHGGGGGNGGRGQRWPVTCPTQQCTVAAGGTCGTSNCVQCFPTFATDGATLTECKTSCTVENCLRCNITNAAQCTECANDGTSPFYLNAEGACAACTAQNCAVRGWGSPVGGCRADGFCKKCAKGFGRIADNTCVACDGAQGVENCAVCSQDDATVCFRCKPGFYWDAATKACVACNPGRVTFDGCANCPAAGVCKECNIGFAPVRVARSRAVTCTACPEGCARCDSAGRCAACLPSVKDEGTGATTFWVYNAVSKACYGPFTT